MSVFFIKNTLSWKTHQEYSFDQKEKSLRGDTSLIFSYKGVQTYLS